MLEGPYSDFPPEISSKVSRPQCWLPHQTTDLWPSLAWERKRVSDSLRKEGGGGSGGDLRAGRGEQWGIKNCSCRGEEDNIPVRLCSLPFFFLPLPLLLSSDSFSFFLFFFILYFYRWFCCTCCSVSLGYRGVGGYSHGCRITFTCIRVKWVCCSTYYVLPLTVSYFKFITTFLLLI